MVSASTADIVANNAMRGPSEADALATINHWFQGQSIDPLR
jgi:hypothetical protein